MNFIDNLKKDTARTVLFLLSLCLLTPAWGSSNSVRSAAIASAHPLATAAGESILSQGGNAFDAAVAVSAVLAVVEPYSSGLGGGGLWLLHLADENREVVLDGRETAPGKASSGMYLDSNGVLLRSASLDGALSAAIPGTPAALVHLSQNYGKLTLAQNLAPAITLARDGFKMDRRFAGMLAKYQMKFRADPRAARIFLPDGMPPSAGSILLQPELASTLTEIATLGADGFYRGWVSEQMVESVKQAGGIWEIEDLENYRAIEREPTRLVYRGALITTSPLPSSGGATLSQGLNILENFSLSSLNEVDRTHLIVEALRRAYQDRSDHLGDSDFVDVPLTRLIDKGYARRRSSAIDLQRATTLPQTDEASSNRLGGSETTHFSIMDRSGNRVAATMSINTNFGSGFIAGSTGVLLNNEMDDFSVSPNVPNVYGLQGGLANSIMPGKRPLSSMSPTFVEDERGILILGTPGGSRIISMVLLAIVNYVDHRQTNPGVIVASPRFHHQHLPDRVEIEPDSFREGLIEGLRMKGHRVDVAPQRWGNMQLIHFDKVTGRTTIANDPRGESANRY